MSLASQLLPRVPPSMSAWLTQSPGSEASASAPSPSLAVAVAWALDELRPTMS